MSFVARIFIVLFLTLILEVYFYKKLFNAQKSILPIDSSRLKKWIWIIIFYLNIYLLIILSYWGYTRITGEGFRFIIENNFWDYFILYPYWVSVMFIIQSVLILLPVDIISLALKLIFKEKAGNIRKGNYIITLLVVIFFALYVPARSIYDYYAVELREVTYQDEKLPEELTGFKIAFISDVQADWYTNIDRLSNFVEKVNSANPDLILMAGDVITGTPDYINISAEQLSRLKAPYGTYTCVGDHDNWAYRGDLIRSRSEVTAALARYNIKMLDDRNEYIRVETSEIGISFLTESYSQRISNKLIDSLLTGLESSNLKIVVSHQPANKIISEAIQKNINLMLCGHTHGGQITFIFPFIDLTPTLFETRHVKGDFFYDNLQLIITRGLGMSLVPIRYNSTPEITLITIN